MPICVCVCARVCMHACVLDRETEREKHFEAQPTKEKGAVQEFSIALFMLELDRNK